MSETVRALIFDEPGVLRWQEIAAPKIQSPTDAIVRPIAATTCDLDNLILRGLGPFKGPFAIGHECVAEVCEVGESVQNFRRGDVVVLNWHISCAHCLRCNDGRPNACLSHPRGSMYGLPGLGDWGGTFSDQLRVVSADFALTKLPIGLAPSLVASAADNLPFAYEFTVPHLAQTPGANVLVIGGCGSIALYAVMFAKAAGAGEVSYYDTDKERLEIAFKYGALIHEGKAPKRAGAFPIVVDASASEEGLQCAIRSVDPEGIVSSVGGHFKDQPLPLFEMYRTGTRFYTGRGRGRPHIQTVLRWVSEGRVDPALVVSEYANFYDADKVLRFPSLKPVFTRPAIHALI
jgi:threonine dehydrogenase-like Zn-dependent dehydrogenase